MDVDGCGLRSYLQVAFGGEGPAADGAGEWLLAGVSSLMDLEGAGRGEGLPTSVAVVLLGSPTRRGVGEHRRGGGRGGDQAGGHLPDLRVEAAEEPVDLRLDEGAHGEEGGSGAGADAGSGGLEKLGGQVPHLMREHMLLQVAFG